MLVDNTKRFKQAQDIVWDSVGKDILHGFVESTSEYQASGMTDTKKQALKDKSFSKWTTYLYLTNCDQCKYGSLLKKFEHNMH